MLVNMRADANGVFKVVRENVVIRIRPTFKAGRRYFVADYRAEGLRRLVWRSTLAEATQAANEGIDAILDGNAEVLQLRASDAQTHRRAVRNLDGLDIALDEAARQFAEMKRKLAGRAEPLECVNDWLKRHDVRLPKKSLAETADACIAAQRADGKSDGRIKQLEGVFNRFKSDNYFAQVADITTDLLSAWLVGLGLSERSRKNHRDAIGFLCRWAVMRGYLARGTNWLEGVQKYNAIATGEIEIYSPEEMKKLLAAADDSIVPFIVVQAFAGLRHAEAARLDWQEIKFARADESFIEVHARNSKVRVRRLPPMLPNLKKWLAPLRKDKGPLCNYVNTTKQLLKVAAAAGVTWKHNGLRHSFISYRVAAIADVPRVADEAGNSPQIIRQHYLRRVTPALAREWFSIQPKATP